MWKNSSAYSRVRFEDIATITSKNNHKNQYGAQQPLNINKHLNFKVSQHQLRRNTNKVNPTKANYNNIEKLILCLMETLQWLHLEMQPIHQVILLFEQKYLQRSTKSGISVFSSTAFNISKSLCSLQTISPKKAQRVEKHLSVYWRW